MREKRTVGGEGEKSEGGREAERKGERDQGSTISFEVISSVTQRHPARLDLLQFTDS